MDIVIPAAGASSRMAGQDKLARPIDGIPLLRRSLLTALELGERVIVTLRPESPRAGLIADLPVEIRLVVDADEGLAASLRRGAEGWGALMILPADMPDLDATDLARLQAAHRARPDLILRGASSAGVAGHPVVFPADLRPAFQSLRGDRGAKPLLDAHPERLRLIPLAADHALTDLDTPEAWAAWEAGRA